MWIKGAAAIVEYDPLEPTSSQSRTLHRLYVRSELGHGFDKSLDRYKAWLEAGFRENRCATSAAMLRYHLKRGPLKFLYLLEIKRPD